MFMHLFFVFPGMRDVKVIYFLTLFVFYASVNSDLLVAANPMLVHYEVV